MSDADRVTPKELGFGWMLRGVRDGTAPFVGSEAIRRELAEGTSRWATAGIVVDWADWDRLHRDAGLFPPKSEHPLPYESMLYHDDAATRSATAPASSTRRCSSATSASPGSGPTWPRRAPSCGSSSRQPPQHDGPVTTHADAVLRP